MKKSIFSALLLAWMITQAAAVSETYEIKAPAFLDVEKFPLITFKNTSAQRVNDQQYTLSGDLTFHGVTKPLTLRSNLVGQSKDSKGESHTGSDIYLVIKRSEFGIKGDTPAVGDDILLTIRVRN
jgi:polyisoprenoid-binding protein YceI